MARDDIINPDVVYSKRAVKSVKINDRVHRSGSFFEFGFAYRTIVNLEPLHACVSMPAGV